MPRTTAKAIHGKIPRITTTSTLLLVVMREATAVFGLEQQPVSLGSLPEPNPASLPRSDYPCTNCGTHRADPIRRRSLYVRVEHPTPEREAVSVSSCTPAPNTKASIPLVLPVKNTCCTRNRTVLRKAYEPLKAGYRDSAGYILMPPKS